MSASPKRAWLQANQTLNTTAECVTDPLFQSQAFFDANDLLQVKYEMLRRVQIDGWTVSRAASHFGFSRPSFYTIQAAFARRGLAGLLPEKSGPKSAHKLTDDVIALLCTWLQQEPALSSRTLAQRLSTQLQLSIHPRSIERALQQLSKKNNPHPH